MSHSHTRKHGRNHNNKTKRDKLSNKGLNDFTLKHFEPITDVICSKHPYQSFEANFQKE